MSDISSRLRFGLYADIGGERLWLAEPGIDWHGNAFSPHVLSWLTAEAAQRYRDSHFPPGADVWVDSLGLFPASSDQEEPYVPNV